MRDSGTAPRLHWQWDEPSQGAPAASIDLTFDFEREGRLWVGTCRELSTSTYGRNRQKVHDALKELVIEHLNLLEESGERGRFFDEWGITLNIPPVHPTASPPPQPDAMLLHQKALGVEPGVLGATR